MLHWFEKSAPIRLKFKVLLAILGLFTAGGIATTYLAALADPAQVHVYLAIACVLTALTMVTVFVAGKLISDPYVATVVRMEGLAAGDLTTPIANTDYRDCIGRLSRAMEIFKENAERVQAGAAARSLSAESDELARHVARFKVGDGEPKPVPAVHQLQNRAADAGRRIARASRRATGGGAAVAVAPSDDWSEF